MNDNDGLVLAVDLGSGGPKVGYTTLTGEPVWWSYQRQDVVGGADVQDPNEWWDAIVAGARRGISEGGVRAERVVGVGITGQWASTVPVDADSMPVAECLMWSDTRGGEYSARQFAGPVAGYSPRALATWMRRSGGIPNAAGSDPVGHMLHLRHDRPEVAAKARWYLEPVDYLTMRLTGIAAASPMSMTAAWLTDNRDLSAVGYDPVLVRLAGVDAERLPPLVPSGSVIGTVRPQVADAIGIPAHAQVVTGCPDLHGSTAGTGCVQLYRPHLSLGTSSWVTCPVPEKKTDVIRQIAAVPGLGDGNYLLANNQDNAGRALEWYRDAFAPGTSIETLVAEAESAAPGAGGVLFTPWLTGERCPVDDRRARGGFHNVSLAAGRPQLTRAVLEGVGYNTAWLLSAVEKFAGRRFDPIRAIGGGTCLDLWCQIVSDICDRSIERVAQPLAGGVRGAGLLFGMASGAVRADDAYAAVPVERTFTPNPMNRQVYQQLSAEFPKLYARDKKMFARLNGR